MRYTVIGTLAALGLSLAACNYPRRQRQPSIQTGTTATHRGSSAATLNTSPGIDAFGAGRGGSGTGGSGNAGQTPPPARHASTAWKASLITSNGTWRTSVADQRLMRSSPQSIRGDAPGELRSTGQNDSGHVGGFGAQLGEGLYQRSPVGDSTLNMKPD